MKSTRHALAALATLVIAFAPAAFAHDVVLVPAKDRVTVRYGHPGDWLSIDDEKLLDFGASDATAKPVYLQDKLKRRGLELLLHRHSTAPVLFSARYDNGLWLKLPGAPGAKEQWRNASSLMLPGASDSMASLKFAKGAVLTAADTTVYKQQLGHLLELIPQANPATLKAAQTLPVLVRFNGKPLAGAGIEVSDLVTVKAEDKIARYQTDANGIAQVPLRPRGLNVLAVDVQHPNDGSLGPAAKALPVDRFQLIATYAFVR